MPNAFMAAAQHATLDIAQIHLNHAQNAKFLSHDSGFYKFCSRTIQFGDLLATVILETFSFESISLNLKALSSWLIGIENPLGSKCYQCTQKVLAALQAPLELKQPKSQARLVQRPQNLGNTRSQAPRSNIWKKKRLVSPEINMRATLKQFYNKPIKNN